MTVSLRLDSYPSSKQTTVQSILRMLHLKSLYCTFFDRGGRYFTMGVQCDQMYAKFLQCVVCVRNTQNRGLEKSQGWLTTIWPFFQQRKGALQIAAQLGISM